jgi:glycosyltransferase involved in cell wall biosynthesis
MTVISIITPSYNSEKYIRDTIESVLNQTYTKIEYIIVDGNSTDNTVNIIKEYEPKFKEKGIVYKWISEPDNGMYAAINKGFKMATGEIITYINSDDYYCNENVIEKVAQTFSETGCKCIYGNSKQVNANGVLLKKVPALPFKKRYIYTLGLFFFQPSFFWKRELFDKTGYCNLNYKICSDFDLITRLIIASEYNVAKLNEYIVNFRVLFNSFGNTNSKIAGTEIHKIKDKLNSINLTPLFILCMYSLLDRIYQKVYRLLNSRKNKPLCLLKSHQKVLIVTAHPAGYMDVLFDYLEKQFSLTVWYNFQKDSEKQWQKQEYYNGSVLSSMSMIEIAKKLKEQDFVIIGGWNSFINLFMIMYLILIRKSFAVWSDVPDEHRINFIKKTIKKVGFCFIPYFFLTGKTGEEHFQKYYGIPKSKIKYFPYAISLPNYNEIKDFNIKRKLILENNPSEKIKIFIANRFIQRKGYDCALKVFQELKNKNLLDKFSIKIAGTGEEFEFYKNSFKSLDNSIVCLGWIEVDDYYKNMKETDIYIHASYFEPYGIPVLDAMAHGKLVIASSGVMSAVDNITNGINAYLYEKNSCVELCKILEYVIYNKKEIYCIGEKALNKSKEFDLEKYVISIFSALNE